MALAMIPAFSLTASATGSFTGASSGNGTASSPYIIANAADFIAFRDYINITSPDGGRGQYFRLTANINLGGREKPWTPIGSEEKPFEGMFDGIGRTISGLYLEEKGENPELTESVGLFGTVSGGMIQNVNISDSAVIGTSYVGMIVGHAKQSAVINHCSVSSGTVSGEMNVGGIVGFSDESDVKFCSNQSAVSVNVECAGGIVGSGRDFDITSCDNSGTVSGKGDKIGGIIGDYNSRYSGFWFVWGCRNMGTVTGVNIVGGIAGEAVGNIQACHNINTVSGKGKEIGGIVGIASTSDSVSDCHNTGEVSGEMNVGGIAGGAQLSDVERCSNAGSITVTGSMNSGGIVGALEGAAAEECYNTDSVSGENAVGVGGIVGEVGSHCTVSCCYNTAEVSGRDSVGGIAGINYVDEHGVTSCYNYGKVNASDSMSGAIVGYGGGSTNCYYLEGTADAGDKGAAVKTEKEFYTLASALNAGGDKWNDYRLSEFGRPRLVNNKENSSGGISGNGKKDAPYLIKSLKDMEAVSDYVNTGNGANEYFKLTADINLGGREKPWTPIGSEENPFKGTFDGDGHTISGLYTDSAESNNVGLFGYVDGGTIKNLDVDGTVTGGENVGLAAGYLKSGTIDNCAATGRAAGNKNAGGIVGASETGASVTSCYNEAALRSAAAESVGGIVGNNGGSVKNCYNISKSVTGQTNYGGIAGSSSGTIESCYNYGEIEKKEEPGDSVYGAVVGTTTGTVTNCFYLTGTSDKGIGSGEGSAEGKNADGFAALSAKLNGKTAVWQDSPFLKRPILLSNPEHDADGLGTKEDPYTISTAEHLRAVANYINTSSQSGDKKYFKLENDIDLGGSEAEQWDPIGRAGYGENNYSFNGEFDGCGHVISGLYIDDEWWMQQGLFGVVGASGVIKNLGVTGYINGGTEVGGIVGYNEGNIENCYSAVTVISHIDEEFGDTDSDAGGVAGSNIGTISNCFNIGSVTGDGNYVGGVAGYSPNLVKNSYSAANVQGVDGVGGIVGYTAGGSTSITNCYSYGSVTGSENVGGIVGENTTDGSGKTTVKNCYYLKDTAEYGVGNDETTKDGAEIPSEQTAAKTAEEFKTLAEALNAGVEGTWEDSEFLGRPILIAVSEIVGEGTANTPYLIPSLSVLKSVRDHINVNGSSNEHFKLTADIDIAGSADDQWAPIGTETNKFQGTFDGDGHKISGLYINTEDDIQGLFGYIDEAGTVKNLGVKGSVTAGRHGGGIAGRNNGTIICCYNGANVKSNTEYAYVGGIVGDNSGKIENCYNTGSIEIGVNGAYAGGIAGVGGTIENCYNTSKNITASSTLYAGAIIGYAAMGCRVTNCYYLEKENLKGVGSSNDFLSPIENLESKTEEEFNSGEVTWLLQKGQTAPDTQVWGQKIGAAADEYPVLTGDTDAKVLKVTFATNDNESYAAKYTNSNGTVEMPEKPVKDNYTFEKWSQSNDAAGTEFNEKTTVSADMTVHAVGRDYFGGDSDITLNETYGYKEAITANLDDYMKYANESVTSKNKFTYSIESDENYTQAKIESENTLSVPIGLDANDYTIKVKAHEKEPQYSLMSVESNGAEDVTLTITVSISKAEPSVTSVPTAADLTYNGEEQELVTAGETADGTIEYSTDGDTYSTDIPKGTEAKEYTVWYKVVGDSNHNDSEPQQVENVEIKRAAPKVTAPTAKDLTYTGEAQELVTAGETADGTIQYSKDNENYSADIPTEMNAGTYSVWYKVIGDSNHNDTEPVKIENINIGKAEPIAVVTPKDLTYTGEAQELVTGETADGTLKYATDEAGEYTDAVPTGTEADTYTVWYMVEGDKNHNNSTPQSVDVTIKKADSTLAVDGGEVTYGDTITLTAAVARDNTNDIRLAAVDAVEFYLGETPLGSGTVTYDSLFNDSGTATLTITADKKFEIGANTIRAEYGGSVNLNGSENNSITVTMNKKPLTYTVTADGKVYDENTSVNVTLTPTNKVGEDNVTLTAKGAVSSADVGSYDKVDLTEIALDGDDAEYYSVETEKSGADLKDGIEITRADGIAAVTMADYKCGDESINPVPASDTNGINNVTYTYSVKDADEYGEEKPLLAGEYTVKAVFEATNNYNEVTVTDDFVITHNWDEWTITEEPTQTMGGMAERDCLSADNDAPDRYALPNLTDASVWTKGTYMRPTPDREGSQEYTSEYGTVTEIIPQLVVTEIRVKNNPVDTTVTESMVLDVTGLEVEAVYSDNSTADVTHDCKLSYDTSAVGTQTVTVEYGGKTAAFNITVAAKELTGITITKKPDKRLYNKGDSLDTAGMVVTASYNNGTEAQITDYTTQGYSPQTVGTQTVAVSYGGFTAEFTVTVEEVTAPSGTVPTPVIETSGFYGGKTVTLTCAAADARIYYTTDGSAPTSASTLYTEPLTVTATTVIKAIAVKDGMEPSRAASGKVSVSKTDAIVPSIEAGEVEAGTLVTLRSASSGAEIFYTIDGTAPTTESARYGGAITVTEEMTIKAIAVKNGYAASDVCELSYTVKEREPNTANLSVGSAVGKAGDTVYVPIYITADGDITDYRFTLTFDSTKLAYASVSSTDGAAGNIFTSLGENAVTVLYRGSSEVKSGEVCRVGFKALDGAADGEYTLAVSGAEISVGNMYCGVTSANGKVTLSTPDIKVSADAVFTDSDGNEVDMDSMSGEVDASLTIDEVEGTDGEQPMIANILLAVYDRSGALAALNVMETDLSDTSFVFQKTISIPANVSVGSIKMMIWNGLSDMSPLTAASKML